MNLLNKIIYITINNKVSSVLVPVNNGILLRYGSIMDENNNKLGEF